MRSPSSVSLIRRPARLLTALIAAVAVCTVARPAASEPATINVRYQVLYGGIRAASVEVEIKLAESSYEIVTASVTEGLMGWMTGFRSRAESRGALTPNGATLTSHRADNVWRGDKRFVRIAPAADGTMTADVSPPPEKDERDPIRPEQTTGTLDPMSAALRAVRALGRTGACDQRVPVYDGRRRYDMVFDATASDTITGPRYSGPAVRCRYVTDRIAGFSRRPFFEQPDKPPESRVWVAPLDPRLPPIPVRLEIESSIATTMVHLESYSIGP